MSALDRAHAHLTNAIAGLEEAVEEVPEYAVESLRFLRAELRDAQRRVKNVERVIGAAVQRAGR